MDITVVNIHFVVAEAARRARQRRPGVPGRSCQKTSVAALRARFNRAHAAGSIATNPAAASTRPRRARSRRRALDDHDLAELIDAIRTTGNDLGLDRLLVRFHLETGARRQGTLQLQLCAIDHRCSPPCLVDGRCR
jgi:site-specific recombinase XerC